jgi:hypothetical protein
VAAGARAEGGGAEEAMRTPQEAMMTCGWTRSRAGSRAGLRRDRWGCGRLGERPANPRRGRRRCGRRRGEATARGRAAAARGERGGRGSLAVFARGDEDERQGEIQARGQERGCRLSPAGAVPRAGAQRAMAGPAGQAGRIGRCGRPGSRFRSVGGGRSCSVPFPAGRRGRSPAMGWSGVTAGLKQVACL